MVKFDLSFDVVKRSNNEVRVASGGYRQAQYAQLTTIDPLRVCETKNNDRCRLNDTHWRKNCASGN